MNPSLMSERTIRSWIQDILEQITDYYEVNLQDKDFKAIIDELVGYDFLYEDTVECEINRRLPELGYTYNENECMWKLGKKFTVSITETLNREITVIAQSNAEAMKKVHEQYDNEEIVLDSNDFVDAHFDSWLCENEEC